MNTLQTALKEIGVAQAAEACGVSRIAVRKWIKAGRLPRTEFTGETDYSTRLSRLSGGRYAPGDLLVGYPKTAA